MVWWLGISGEDLHKLPLAQVHIPKFGPQCLGTGLQKRHRILLPVFVRAPISDLLYLAEISK